MKQKRPEQWLSGLFLFNKIGFKSALPLLHVPVRNMGFLGFLFRIQAQWKHGRPVWRLPWHGNHQSAFCKGSRRKRNCFLPLRSVWTLFEPFCPLLCLLLHVPVRNMGFLGFLFRIQAQWKVLQRHENRNRRSWPGKNGMRVLLRLPQVNQKSEKHHINNKRTNHRTHA